MTAPHETLVVTPVRLFDDFRACRTWHQKIYLVLGPILRLLRRAVHWVRGIA